MLIQLLVLILVVAIVFWLLQNYVAPALPPPFRVWVLAVAALIVIVVLIQIVFPNALTGSFVH